MPFGQLPAVELLNRTHSLDGKRWPCAGGEMCSREPWRNQVFQGSCLNNLLWSNLITIHVELKKKKFDLG